jgi:type IV secretory pathway TraG/TraD family ATPase VirD4
MFRRRNEREGRRVIAQHQAEEKARVENNKRVMAEVATWQPKAVPPPPPPPPDEPLGSAKFSRDPGSSRADALNGRRFFFGKRHRDNWYALPPKGNLLTVAQARSGKGTCIIVPNLLKWRGSALVIDPKGENAWLTAAIRQGRGQRTYTVDPWDEVNRKYGSKLGFERDWTAKFNPMSILKPDDPDFLDNLAYLSEACIISLHSKDKYFDDMARELWSGLMAYVVENPAYSDLACMALVRGLLTRPNDELKRTIDSAVEMSGSVAARKLAQFKDWDKSAGVAGIVATARVQTAFLDNDFLARNMEKSDFSFDVLRENGQPSTIYLVLPPDKFDTYGRWLRLLISVAIGAVQKGPLEKGAEQLEAEAAIAAEKAAAVALAETTAAREQAERERAASDAALMKITGRQLWENVPKLDLGIKLFQSPMERLDELIKQTGGGNEEFRKMFEENEKKRQAADRERRSKLKWFGIHEDAQTAVKAARKDAIGLPALFMLDEFGTIGKLSMVAKGFGIVAGLGMCMWVFVQDLNQLKRDYPDDWETFVSNSGAVCAFGIMDQFTANYISEMLGKKTVRHTTTSTNRSKGTTTGGSENTKVDEPTYYVPPQSWLDDWMYGPRKDSEEKLSGHSTSNNTSETVSENTAEQVSSQPLASADELRRMQGQCIVIGNGYPVLCDLVPYYTDAEFRYVARQDPRFEPDERKPV